MDTQTQILRILDDALSLGGRAARFNADTPLLGALPELDSMGVVTLIGALEDQLGVSVDDRRVACGGCDCQRVRDGFEGCFGPVGK